MFVSSYSWIWFSTYICVSLSQHICLSSCLFSWRCVSICKIIFWIDSSTHNHFFQAYTLTHLDYLLNFHPADPPITTTSSSVAPPASHKHPPHSLTLSATIPPSSNPALLSPSACFFDDHYAGIGSPPLELHPTLIMRQALLHLLLQAQVIWHIVLQVCNSLLISHLILFSNFPIHILLPLGLPLGSIRWFFTYGCRKLPFS